MKFNYSIYCKNPHNISKCNSVGEKFENGNIVFYSYEEPIGIFIDGQNWLFINEDKFSVTTSKHTNYVLRVIRSNYICYTVKYINRYDMRKIVEVISEDFSIIGKTIALTILKEVV
jgi:hypothetical protein